MGSIVWDSDIAAVYDTVYASGFTASALDPMVDVLTDLSQGGPALEFAVGTGRVALALSAHGVRTHGIELSPHMTEQLRSKPGAAAVPVTVGDMTAVRLTETFPLVYLVANTIMNVTTQEDQERVFHNAALHLEPGGRFVVEVVVPQPPSAGRGERARVFALDPHHVGVETFDDLVGQIAWSHHWMDVDGRLVKHSAPYRYVWPSELDLMAKLAGLRLQHRWADWHRAPFQPDSPAHVSVYQKPPPSPGDGRPADRALATGDESSQLPTSTSSVPTDGEATMSDQRTTHLLDVPGAKLYYEVRGSGPLLFVIGQPMTSEPFGPLADLMADQHTVVTYDPRGLGQSTADDPSLDVTPEIEADDLAHLIDAVGGGPADVFASSGGAVAGLALAARHPEHVGVLVAHEPPVTELLPDAENVRAVVDDIEQAYRDGGSGAAWGKFVSLVMHAGPVTADGVPPAAWPPAGADTTGDSTESDAGEPARERSQKQAADDELFFLRMLKPFTRYEPDLDALRSGRPRVVIGVGAASKGEVAARSAVALAERLGSSTTAFPGDHGGFMSDPAAFASRLRQTVA